MPVCTSPALLINTQLWVELAATAPKTVFNGFTILSPVRPSPISSPSTLSRSVERFGPVLRQEGHFGQDRIIGQT